MLLKRKFPGHNTDASNWPPMYFRLGSEFILIQMLQFLACGLVGVRFSVTGRESWQECWNYIAGPTRTIKSREGKSHNEWTPLSTLQRAAPGLVRPAWTRTNRCHVLWGETKGRTRTKPHKATDINPSAVPMQLFLYDDVLPLNPLTVKSATIRTTAVKQNTMSKDVQIIPKTERRHLRIRLSNCRNDLSLKAYLISCSVPSLNTETFYTVSASRKLLWRMWDFVTSRPRRITLRSSRLWHQL